MRIITLMNREQCVKHIIQSLSDNKIYQWYNANDITRILYPIQNKKLHKALSLLRRIEQKNNNFTKQGKDILEKIISEIYLIYGIDKQ